MADKAPKFPTGAYMDFVNGVLDTLPDRLAVRAKDNGAYARIPKPIANYMAGPLALESISRALDNMESHGQPRHQVIGELEKAERRDIQEYTDILVVEARDDKNPLIVSAVYYMLMAKLPEVIKHFKQSPNAVTWWTRAPVDFDGFNTYRTGNTADLAYSVFTPAVTYYEVKIDPSAVDWQIRRYSSGNYASMNEEEKHKMEEAHAKSLAEQAQNDMLKAAWPEFIAKLKTFDIEYIDKNYDRSKWVIGGAGQSIIDAHAYVTDAYNKWHALAPVGYPPQLRDAADLRNALESKAENARHDIVSMAKQADIDEHNRQVFQQAYNAAESWLYANGLDTVTPYFSRRVGYANRYGQVSRGPYYAALRSAAVVREGDKVYPAIGDLPIFGEYPKSTYFVEATDHILNSAHTSDTAAIEWMRKNMKLFANGVTSAITVLSSANAYSGKIEGKPDGGGFMAMTGAAAHTTLSGAAKAAATRAMAAKKYATFSFAPPYELTLRTYPDQFAERICSTHRVADWKGHAAKWKLAK